MFMEEDFPTRVRPICSMQQMVFAGFTCGFLGLGLSLSFSFRSLGRARFVKRILVWTFLAFSVEFLLFLDFGIVIHLISGYLGKLFHDRWIVKLRATHGGNYLSNREFCRIFLIPFLAWLAIAIFRCG
jgi:hypothetical protein